MAITDEQTNENTAKIYSLLGELDLSFIEDKDTSYKLSEIRRLVSELDDDFQTAAQY